MNDKKRKDSDLIQKLIENEVEAVFCIMPEKELRSRLEERLAGGRKQRWFRYAFLKPVPVLAATLVVLCGVLIGVLAVGKRSESPPKENLIARFLERTPGVQTLAQWEELSRLKSEANRLSMPPLPNNFIGFFRRLEEDVSYKRPVVQIPDLHQYPALDHRQVLEILFKKKAVHQFLMQFSEKKEEEKNG